MMSVTIIIYLYILIKLWRVGIGNFPIGKNIIYSLFYANDHVVFSEDKEDMEYIARKLDP